MNHSYTRSTLYYHNAKDCPYRVVLYHEGRYHNVDGPAVLFYDERGKIIETRWYLDGKRHREDGPAHTWVSSYGGLTRHWYLHDELIPAPEKTL